MDATKDGITAPDLALAEKPGLGRAEARRMIGKSESLKRPMRERDPAQAETASPKRNGGSEASQGRQRDQNRLMPHQKT